MQNKKLFNKFIAIELCAIMLAGCGQSGNAPAGDDSSEEQTVGTQEASDNTSTDVAEDGETLSDEEANETAEKDEAVERDHLHVNVTHMSQYHTVSEQAQYSTKFPKVFLDEGDEETYPQLQAALEEYNRKEEADAEENSETMADYISEFTSNTDEEVDSDYFRELTYEATGTVIRADKQVFSLNIYRYYDFAGAHPTYYYTGANFDVSTGERLSIFDVIKDKEKFLAITEEKLKEEYTEAYENAFQTLEEYDQTIGTEDYSEDYDWILDSEGITVFFNIYTLAPFVAGAQTIRIRFEEAPEIFEEKYTQVPDSYVIPLLQNADFTPEMDVNGNGKTEKLSIVTEYEYEDYDDWKNYSVKLGNRQISLDTSSYSIEPYIVKNKDEYYLYASTSMEGGGCLYVVNLADLTYDPDRISFDEIGRYFFDYGDDGDSNWNANTKTAFTDPEAFYLETRMDLLSTYSGYRTYHVDEEGYPVSNELYKLDDISFVLKAKTDMICDQVDEDGNIISSDVQMKKDDYLMFVRTDGESFVDFQVVDGSDLEISGEDDWMYYYLDSEVRPRNEPPYLRIYVDRSTWPAMIEDMEETDVFSGIMYAG